MKASFNVINFDFLDNKAIYLSKHTESAFVHEEQTDSAREGRTWRNILAAITPYFYFKIRVNSSSDKDSPMCINNEFSPYLMEYSFEPSGYENRDKKC